MALFCAVRPVHAASNPEADASARILTETKAEDMRIYMLSMYLSQKNSPLANKAGFFVIEADRLDLDWRLVAAISGVESTFGKHIPQHSYNAWGWGIPTGASHGIGFSSWEEGITTVSEGLKYRYIDRGAVSIEAIGRVYAASPAWSAKVRWMISDIDAFVARSTKALAMTI